MEVQINELITHAKNARVSAYAPYSNFTVGAALLTGSGEIIDGCNVENISYGLTMCAERVALGTAINKGHSTFEALALVTDSKEPVVPCGACRQVLAEFCPALKIVSATIEGMTAEFNLAELLPFPHQGILG